jgi:O-antigen/teichoic acid export membrane protein
MTSTTDPQPDSRTPSDPKATTIDAASAHAPGSSPGDPPFRERGGAFSDSRLRSSYVWTAGGVFGGQGLLWLVSLYVARLLQPQDYGLLAMATVFLSFCQTLQDAGLSAAVIQSRDTDQRALSTAFWFLCGTGVSATLLGVLIAPGVAWIYHEPRVIPVLRVLSFTFVIMALRAVQFSLLAKELQFAKSTKAELASSFGGALLTILLAWNGFGVWSLVCGNLASAIALTLLTYWFSRWRPSFEWDRTALKRLLEFGLPNTGAMLLWQIYYQADFLVIGALLNSVALGFYTMAWRLAMISAERITAIFSKVSFPAFASLQKNPREAALHWLQITEIVSWITFPLLVGMMLVAEPFVHIALTAKWAASVPVLRLLCVLAIMRSLGMIMPPLISALGRPRVIFGYNVVCLVVFPPAFAMAALRGGIAGVGIAWLVVYLPLWLWLIHFTLKLTDTPARDYLRRLLWPAGCTAIMIGAVLLSRLVPAPKMIYSLLMQIGVGGLVYAACGFWRFHKTARLELVRSWFGAKASSH